MGFVRLGSVFGQFVSIRSVVCVTFVYFLLVVVRMVVSTSAVDCLESLVS